MLTHSLPFQISSRPAGPGRVVGQGSRDEIGNRAVLFTVERVVPPPELLAVTFEVPLTQMTAAHVGPPRGGLDVLELGPTTSVR